jgi:hypothetical protein
MQNNVSLGVQNATNSHSFYRYGKDNLGICAVNAIISLHLIGLNMKVYTLAALSVVKIAFCTTTMSIIQTSVALIRDVIIRSLLLNLL